MQPRTPPVEHLIRWLLAAALLGGSLFILSPLLAPIVWAGILVISTWPLFVRLRRRVHSANLAATLGTLVLLLLFAGPIALMGTSLADLTDSAVTYARTRELPKAPEFLGGIPYIGHALARRWNEAIADIPAFIASLKPYEPQIRAFVLRVGGAMGQALLLLLLSAVFAFFLYRDGDKIAARLDRMAMRIAAERGRNLLQVAESTTRSVVYGIAGTAAVQGVLAAIGLGIAGVPAPLLLGLFVAMFGLIPIGLTGLIMLPAAGWLLLEGRPLWGVFVALWGLFVVGGVDNFVRPMLISRGARLPMSIVLTGVLGGLITLGVLGIFIGAVLLGVVYVMLQEWSEMEPKMPLAALAADPDDEIGSQ
ncbi:MAG TPA: AI-2E family transporter [Burkholderiales bacterium]|nr:AI-2E family transporter [Burkholderiales bacterium]